MRPSSNVDMIPDSANPSTLNERKVSLGFKWLRIEKIEKMLELHCPLNLEFPLQIHR